MRTARARTGIIATLALLTGPAANAQDAPPREPGVSVRFYDIGAPMTKVRPLVPGQTPNASKVVPLVDFRGRRGDFEPFDEYFYMVVEGFIEAPSEGEYAFELSSDDGSKLWIDRELVCDNDGEHGTVGKTGTRNLSQGLHPFQIIFFQGAGEKDLILKWRPAGSRDFALVPNEALSCTKGEVRVTSPGRKKLILPLERGRPGDGRPLEDVHPSYDLATVHPEGFNPKVGGIGWLSDGRMVMCTWDPIGAVYILDGVTAPTPGNISVKRIAAGLAEPLGLVVVDDDIFVLQKQELTQLIDHDGDETIDEYRSVCSGWNVTDNFHEFAFGLVYRDGFFYANLAIAINPGGRSTRPQIAERGSVIRISREKGAYEIIAHGLRAPNGIGFGVDGEIFLTDNQGDWLPVSKVLHLREGAFYGSQAVLLEKARDLPVAPPVVWLPQGEIGNSPGNVVPMKDQPYAGQMLHCDITHGGVKRVFAEKIDGEYQGCVFRFTQGLEAGVNRISWGPDGALYCGGIGSTGDWGQTGKKWFGLQRLKHNGRSTFEMLAVRAMGNGFEIEFTEPLPEGAGREPERYYLQRYWYEPTEEYGGPKMDEARIDVKSASVSSDRRRVFLELDRADLEPGRVYYVHLLGPWASEAGRSIWSTEAWYTLNNVPSDREGHVDPDAGPRMPAHNTLTEAEKAAGWTLLFDGRTTSGWRNFKQPAISDGWGVEDDCLTIVGRGGDIITDRQFESFELSLEWKVEEGGNSGVFWHVAEEGRYVFETGPEMQILDNARHADGENPMTSAGSNYALHAPPFDATYPPGTFNVARILIEDNHVTYWLNGEKQCEFTVGSDEWNQLVAASKFAAMPLFGTKQRGHIALQDHGDKVWFRNIKIREIK
jgi:cytochrome c